MSPEWTKPPQGGLNHKKNKHMTHLQQLTSEQLKRRLQDLLKIAKFDPDDDNLQHEMSTIVDMLETQG